MGLDDAVGQLTAWLATGKQSVITALPNLATALLVLVVGWGLAWVLRRAVLAAFRRIAARLPRTPGWRRLSRSRPGGRARGFGHAAAGGRGADVERGIAGEYLNRRVLRTGQTPQCANRYSARYSAEP